MKLCGFVALHLLHLVTGLRVTGIEVPRWLLVGQKATLRCHIDPEGERIYSVTWWKDGGQFLQYIPQNTPSAVVFTVPGIAINPAMSTQNTVQLVDVQRSSGGRYRCEVVAEGPTFTTSSMEATIAIVDAPDSRPVISGVADSYRQGELIRVNCTSPRSSPAAELTWSMSGRQVSEERLVKYDVFKEEVQHTTLYTSTLGLTLPAKGESLDLRCTSKVYDYEWVSDVSLHLDPQTMSQPHHLPTQLQTSKSGGPRFEAATLARFLFIFILDRFIQRGSTLFS